MTSSSEPRVWDLDAFRRDPALIEADGTVLTYGQLADAGQALAQVASGRCLVFALCRNSIGSVVGYTAFLNAGIVPVLLSAHLEPALLNDLLALYRPKYLWVPAAQAGTFVDVRTVYSAYDYCLLRTGYGAETPLYPELGLLLTTSGSTGSPKLVRQSYANIRANATSIAQYLELTAAERPITTLPMSYTYGLSILNSHLLVGAALLLTDHGLMQKEFWQFFKAQGATSFGGVPYTYEMLDRLRFYRMDLPSLRYTTQAGGKLTPALHQKFAADAQRRGTKFIVMYGQCEATARMGYLPADKAVEKCGSMGIAIPGGTFRLVDADGRTVTAPDTAGELVYEGPNVTLGYAECAADLAKGDERHGVLATGDMARFDADGYYYIVGRKKRFLKIYGNRVNLDEVDRLLKARFNNLDCASAGVDDHMYLFITAPDLAAEVKAYAAGKTLYRALEPYYTQA